MLRIPDVSARTPDGYSAAAAARVLGVSERRVRQLVTAGSLPALSLSPLRVPQDAVHRERDRRRRSAPRTSAGRPPAGPPEQVDVKALVEATVRAILPLMLAPAERAEADAKAALTEERALRIAAEARAAVAEARLAEQTPVRRRRRWSRRED
jgi:hypothetical protein